MVAELDIVKKVNFTAGVGRKPHTVPVSAFWVL